MSTDKNKEYVTHLNQEPFQAAASHSQIQQIIGVMSAKGGVGKSLVTGLLASGLAKQGFQVGILDADFTNSSIPMLFGLQGPAQAGQYSFIPLQSRLGVEIISTNLMFKEEDDVVVWKTSLVGELIKQLCNEVEWGSLDYLFIDMPPAVSEVSVEILQALPIKGVVIATTPQGLATKITSKVVNLVRKNNVPVIGVVENMAYYQQPDSDQKTYIFGESHIQSIEDLTDAPLLARIPLNPMISEFCDAGRIEEITLDECEQLSDSFLKSVAVLDAKILAEAQQSVSAAPESTDTDEQTVAPATQPDRTIASTDFQSIVQPYSDIVMHLIRNKENMGTLAHPSAQGFFMGICGDRMQIDINTIDGRIMQAGFVADGCGVTIACGSMITKLAFAKTLQEANQISPEDLITVLGGLPKDHEHCAELAVMTLREAVIDAIEGHATPRKKSG
ncbi:MAG: P-loop NTPase [Anaerolineaceae bacterium]|nr:P-loop NTPase [Anaerolineaceae bacterium]